jgi:endonuclease G
MRYITLALAGLTLGTVAARSPEPPRPLIVLVHGRGQLGGDTALLRREWAADLDSGLVAAGEPNLRDEDVRLAWYADVLDPESDADCVIAQSDSVSIGFAAFARGLFANVAEEEPDVDTRGARNIMSDVLYVMDQGKRCAAQRRVGNVIEADGGNRPVIIVAYSLGALVAYDYLKAAPSSIARNVHLVTLGSPLGVQLLRELLMDGPAPIVPDSLRSWVNVYDPDDMLSAPMHFTGDTLRLRDLATAGSGDEPHNIEHYLRDPATITALRQALHASN